jgi:hypothetical protein
VFASVSPGHRAGPFAAAVEVVDIGVGVVMLRIMICMEGRWIVRGLLVGLALSYEFFYLDEGRRPCERFKS